jgi:hypothetical protein
MVTQAPGSLAPAAHTLRARDLLRRVGARLAAARSAQLVSRRRRVRIAVALEGACVRRRERAVLSAAIPTDWQAVEIARPVLKQLAWALRTRESVESGGVALTQRLLTDGTSALYRPAYPEQLYEEARRALLALGPVGPPTGPVGVRGGAAVPQDQFTRDQAGR